MRANDERSSIEPNYSGKRRDNIYIYVIVLEIFGKTKLIGPETVDRTGKFTDVTAVRTRGVGLPIAVTDRTTTYTVIRFHLPDLPGGVRIQKRTRGNERNKSRRLLP